MDDKTRYAEGMTTRRAVLGGAYVDKASSGLTDFNAEWQEFITRTAQTGRFMKGKELADFIAKDDAANKKVFQAEGWVVN